MLVSSSYDETLVIWDVDNCCQKFALKVNIKPFSIVELKEIAFETAFDDCTHFTFFQIGTLTYMYSSETFSAFYFHMGLFFF